MEIINIHFYHVIYQYRQRDNLFIVIVDNIDYKNMASNIYRRISKKILLIIYIIYINNTEGRGKRPSACRATAG